jgi:hypothetical protein
VTNPCIYLFHLCKIAASNEIAIWLVHLLSQAGNVRPSLRHPLLAPILEYMATMCLSFTTASPAATKWDLRLIKEGQMAQLFKLEPITNTLVEQPILPTSNEWRSLSSWPTPLHLILPIYYMLYYNAAHRVALRGSGTTAPSSRAYSAAMLHRVPIYSALVYIQTQSVGTELEYMAAPYQSMMMDQYPEVVSVDGLLFRAQVQSEWTSPSTSMMRAWLTASGLHGTRLDLVKSPSSGELTNGLLPSPSRVGELLARAIDEPSIAVSLLTTIYRLTKPLVIGAPPLLNAPDPLTYVDSILRTILPLSMYQHSQSPHRLLSRPIVQLFRDLWECWRALLSLQLPQRTLLVIASPIVNSDAGRVIPYTLSWSEMETRTGLSISRLVYEPSLVLDQHEHGIWRYPPLVRVLLHVLHTFLSASRRCYTCMIDDALHVPPPPPSTIAPPRPPPHAAGPAAAAAAAAQAEAEAKRAAATTNANGTSTNTSLPNGTGNSGATNGPVDGNIVAAEINTLLLTQESSALHRLFETCGRLSRMIGKKHAIISISASTKDIDDIAGGTITDTTNSDDNDDELLSLCDAAVGTGRTRTTLGASGTISDDDAKVWQDLETNQLRFPMPSLTALATPIPITLPGTSIIMPIARSLDAMDRQRRVESLWSSRAAPPSSLATDSSVGWDATLATTLAQEAAVRRRAAQSELCGETGAFIHQQFLSNPLLIKLVHFQGYPTHILPTAIEGVASMHACLDFVPELLHQPHHDQQVGMT